MADQTKLRNSAHRRHWNSASQADHRDKVVRQEIEKERAVSAAKTAKLRALRLAKEAADKSEEERRAREKAAAKTSADASRRKRAQDA